MELLRVSDILSQPCSDKGEARSDDQSVCLKVTLHILPRGFKSVTKISPASFYGVRLWHTVAIRLIVAALLIVLSIFQLVDNLDFYLSFTCLPLVLYFAVS
jgi:hypothetical protein